MDEFFNKITDVISKYETDIQPKQVSKVVSKIIEDDYEDNFTVENLKKAFGLIDLTTLSTTDTCQKVEGMVAKVNDFKNHYPDVPNVAAICVYPSLVKTVKENLVAPEVEIASVAGGFPASQTFIEVKVAETSLAAMEGATEIDMVIPVGAFLEEKYDVVFDEVNELKNAGRGAHLKVILETGALDSPKAIKIASVLAMEAGADFIKTSTGKMEPAATLEATYVMAQAIKEFFKKSGKRIGIKPAGGIVTPEDAIKYLTIVKAVLGKDWLTPELFRIGASRLANNILSEVLKREKGEAASVNYF